MILEFVCRARRGIAAALPGLNVRRVDRVRRPVPTERGMVDAIDTLVCAVRE